jgi:predicted RNA-binding Zn ribbon-like protein
VTGQGLFIGDGGAGAHTAVALVNARRALRADDALTALRAALAVDPASADAVGTTDVPGFATLADRLGEVFGSLAAGDVDAAAGRLNVLLAAHPAHPHLAKDDGRWRLHHHPADAAPLPMWTAICAEGLARVLGAGDGRRLGTCAAPRCGRVFLDGSRNGSRRFCSTTCQNRVKATAFRRRGDAGRPVRTSPRRRG